MVRNCCQHPEASQKWWCGCSDVGAGVHAITDSIGGSLTPVWPTEGTFQFFSFVCGDLVVSLSEEKSGTQLTPFQLNTNPQTLYHTPSYKICDLFRTASPVLHILHLLPSLWILLIEWPRADQRAVTTWQPPARQLLLGVNTRREVQRLGIYEGPVDCSRVKFIWGWEAIKYPLYKYKYASV